MGACQSLPNQSPFSQQRGIFKYDLLLTDPCSAPLLLTPCCRLLTALTSSTLIGPHLGTDEGSLMEEDRLFETQDDEEGSFLRPERTYNETYKKKLSAADSAPHSTGTPSKRAGLQQLDEDPVLSHRDGNPPPCIRGEPRQLPTNFHTSSRAVSPAGSTLPIDITPHRTLGTAVPSTILGVPFFPSAAAVSPQLP